MDLTNHLTTGFRDPGRVLGITVLIAGIILIACGFYLRRNGRLHTLQGAAVLAGFVIFVGIIAMGIGALFITRVVMS